MRALLGVLWVLALAPAVANGAVSLAQIGSFASPVFVTGDAERVYVVERAGKIVMVRDGVRSTFLDITPRVDAGGEEQGLLSMATSGSRVFVYYTAPRTGGGNFLTISEFAATPDSADPSTERVVLRVEHPTYDNHNGGQLQIGPDGLLWVATGDGGAGGDPADNGQNTSSLLGKLLRIDPAPGSGCGGRCTIPAGNPGFPAPEVWAYGLRNPYRFSFDSTTGDLWIGDVGQERFEEVDYAAAPGRGGGFDWGWNAKEGYALFASGVPADGKEIDPVHVYPHDDRCSITGGVVVRDPNLPDLFGRYLFADYCAGPISAGVLEAGRLNTTPTQLEVPYVSSFGTDACGRVYVASLTGPVYRLSDTGACAPTGGPEAPAVPAPGGSPVPDSVAPRLIVRAAARQRPLRTGRVRLVASCDEQCALTVRGTFAIRRAGGAAASARPLRTATLRRTLAAAARVPLELGVGASVRRSLRRALARGRRVTLTFSVTARDAAGNSRRTTARSRAVR